MMLFTLESSHTHCGHHRAKSMTVSNEHHLLNSGASSFLDSPGSCSCGGTVQSMRDKRSGGKRLGCVVVCWVSVACVCVRIRPTLLIILSRALRDHPSHPSFWSAVFYTFFVS